MLRPLQSGVVAGNTLGGKSASDRRQKQNWVVVTTINYPTDTLKLLATAADWQVVVVADKKTPEDWALENVIMLSIKQQEALKYTMMDLLPFNHYGRKNIGYLYAIEHGATQVYETDDDNELIAKQPLKLPTFEGLQYYVYNATGVCNPYQFYGFPNIWPRGYPLSEVKAYPCNAFMSSRAKPLVLQGLANLDPDVDAIYRLTQPLNVHFRADLPAVVLPDTVVCPWNSQNTLFARDALWGLLIPITTTFRVCDIWRSYWVQRLLWEIDGNVAFGPPTVEQLRNAHNLMRDFADEEPLYSQAGNLVALLNAWVPPTGSTLPEMMIALAQKMADEKMWEQGDVELMSAWVTDLKSSGYVFPALRDSQSGDKRHQHSTNSASPGERMDSTQIGTSLRTPLHWQRYNGIVAVVMMSADPSGWKDTYELLHEAYTPIFGRIVFAGPHASPKGLPSALDWVSCPNGRQHQYSCLANVLQEYPAPSSGGYLVLADDIMINHCQIQHLNQSKIWFPHSLEPIHEDLRRWEHEQASPGGPATQHALFTGHAGNLLAAMQDLIEGKSLRHFTSVIKHKLGDEVSQVHFGGAYTDTFYIPAQYSMQLLLGLTTFADHDVHHALAVPAALGLLSEDASEYQVLKPLNIHEERSRDPNKILKASLITDGFPHQAFSLHAQVLDWRSTDLRKAFWAWWTMGSCQNSPGIDESWKGLSGITALARESSMFAGNGQFWAVSEQQKLYTHPVKL
ncbi:g6654 [Coccomyxa viridis]|uniref:G6654 protein n=1 Tax=Coccomyxa viridis TaxID=1274662 RepID=A0ABP1FVW8_9CHLO